MGTDDASSEGHEGHEVVTLAGDAEASFKGSGYDAGLSIDTTPTVRPSWPADGEWEQKRSAYDKDLIVDTTPMTRPESASPSSGTDGSVASSDE